MKTEILSYEERYYTNMLDESVNQICEYINENEDLFDENLSEGVVKDKVKQGGAIVRRTVKKTDDKIDNTAAKIMKTLKSFTIGDERENIITNRMKVSGLLKQLLASGALFLINPIIGIMSSMTFLIIKRRMTNREKIKILKELDTEMQIVEEKIKDADSKGDNKAKYKLIRLKAKIENDAKRIKYAQTI